MPQRPPPRRPPPRRPPPVRTARMAESKAPKAPSRRPQLIAAAAVVVVLLLSAWLLANRKPRPDSNTRGDSTAAVLFSEAKTLVRQGRWAAAQEKLLAVREEDDEYEPRQVENYLKVVADELPNEALFATAADATAKGELARASAALAQVKTRTQDRALTDAKQALAQRLDARRGEARALVADAKWEPLLALAADLLAAAPGDREGAEWKQQAEQALARGKRGPTKVVSAETPWLEAQQRFRGGDASGAASLAQACAKKYAQCRAFVSGLDVLEAKSKHLESLGEEDLLTLYKLDKELAGGTSSEASKPLRTRVATRFLLKASQARTTGNWARAVDAARQALAADPSLAAAQAIITEARQLSSDLYLRAYQQRDTDQVEALKLFKQVVEMTPADDQNHVRAQGYIDRLEGR